MHTGLQVRAHFRPELLNRLDEIVIFDPLTKEQLRKIARLQMTQVAQRLAERGIGLIISDAAIDLVLEKAYDPVCNNARWSCICVVVSIRSCSLAYSCHHVQTMPLLDGCRSVEYCMPLTYS